jgi:uncharacterized membrane protein
MTKMIFLYVMFTFYLLAGINHFIHQDFYLAMMPSWVPYPEMTNYVSGACEILLAALLLPESTRALAAWLIIALLIVIFPANIQMSINFWRDHNPNFWITIVRLPFQLLFIWWAWKFTK